eukprot:3429262-Rhodomonas_salina.1
MPRFQRETGGVLCVNKECSPFGCHAKHSAHQCCAVCRRVCVSTASGNGRASPSRGPPSNPPNPIQETAISFNLYQTCGFLYLLSGCIPRAMPGTEAYSVGRYVRY